MNSCAPLRPVAAAMARVQRLEVAGTARRQAAPALREELRPGLGDLRGRVGRRAAPHRWRPRRPVRRHRPGTARCPSPRRRTPLRSAPCPQRIEARARATARSAASVECVTASRCQCRSCASSKRAAEWLVRARSKCDAQLRPARASRRGRRRARGAPGNCRSRPAGSPARAGRSGWPRLRASTAACRSGASTSGRWPYSGSGMPSASSSSSWRGVLAR